MRQGEMIPRKHFQTSFGGELLSSHPKEARPFSPRLAMHVVLKSSLAQGGLSFFKRKKDLDLLVRKQAKKHFIKVYQWQNVGNHMHFVIKAKTRKSFNAFIRSLTGLIPRLLLGAEKGRPHNKKFWDYRPFTRLIRWGQDFSQMKYYLKKNQYEAKGFTTEQAKYLIRIDQLWRRLCQAAE